MLFRSKEILKNALLNYEGTFLIVSHDREFLSGLTNRIWDIEEQHLKIHHFELKEYLNYKVPKEVKTEKPKVAEDKKEQEVSKPTVNRDQEKKIQRVEQQTAKAEQAIKLVEDELAALNYNDSQYQDKLNEYNALIDSLDKLMAEWESLI